MTKTVEPVVGSDALAWAEKALRRSGLRRTTQRVELLAAVRSTGHVTVERLAAVLAPSGVALSTVYRILCMLERAGLVEGATLGTGAAVFHLSGGPAHAHQVCRGCGHVEDVDHPGLSTRPGTGIPGSFVADRLLVVVLGTCSDCLG